MEWYLPSLGLVRSGAVPKEHSSSLLLRLWEEVDEVVVGMEQLETPGLLFAVGERGE